jgi:adenylyltransferase/sulfurtransferase
LDHEGNRYSRQVLVQEIGEDGQERIGKGLAVVIGLGALGSTVANLLARAGVGALRMVDRDFVEWTNLQRQGLYDEEDVRNNLPKAVAAEQHLRRVNSETRYEALVDDVNPTNVERVVAGASVVLDGLDNFYTRALINEACVKAGIPWIHGACISTYGTVATVVPGDTACYNCLFPGAATMISPYTCDTVGVLGPVAFAVASWEALEALKILAGRLSKVSRYLMAFDLWDSLANFVSVSRDPECSVCGHREFDLLSKPEPMMISSICGQNAVQVVPEHAVNFDFEATTARLERLFPVMVNRYLLRAACGDQEIVLFRDGRAMILGTSDPRLAKTLYAKYIGG